VSSLIRTLTSRRDPERAFAPLSVDDWAQMFQFGGFQYPLTGGTTPTGNTEQIEGSFQGYVNGAYKSNGIVFACMLARLMLFSEARFQFRRMNLGRPGALFGTAGLAPLETPWVGGTTGDLLTRMIQDADLAGNSYTVRRAGALRRLRPDWMTIVLGSKTGSEIDAEIIGYAYQPGGPGSGEDPEVLLPEQVAHFAPIPDPLARFRGMSWLSPVVDEIVGDRAATTHKQNFFEQGARLGYVVTLDSDMDPAKFEQWVEKFKQGHEGVVNAYKTLFLGGGADVKTVSANMQETDFKSIQGAGETRIAAAAGVPPVIAGFSEGLEQATYSNYAQARRRFADGTMRPLWRNAAGSLARIVDVPSGAELWYDDRDIPFLQEDMKDEAEIQQTQANAIRSLIDAGYLPDSVVDAVTAGDLTRLKHSGLFSVQLQPAGTQTPPAAQNGNGNGQPTLPASTN
jgi:HK97 family phage portal protein